MSVKRWFTFKEPNEIFELQVIHPYLLQVFAGLVAYIHDRGWHPPIITSMARTEEEQAAVKAESDSHLTLRAFDISSRPYTLEQIQDICIYLNKEFDMYAAVSAKTGNKVLATYHKVAEGAWHVHLQIHRRFQLDDWKGWDK